MELLNSGPKAKGFIDAVRRKSVADAIDYIKDLIRMKENNFELFPIEIL
jgi:hypothetical protein